MVFLSPRQPEEEIKEENDFVAKLMKIPEIRELELRSNLESHDNLPTTAQRQSKSYTPHQAEEESKEGDVAKFRKVSMTREHHRSSLVSYDNIVTTSRRRSKSYTQPEKEKILRDDFVTKLMKIPEIRELAERSGLESHDEHKTTDRRGSKPPTPRQPEEVIKIDEDFVAKLLKIPRVRELAQRSGLEIHEDLTTTDRRRSKPSTPRKSEEVTKYKDDFVETSLKNEPTRPSGELTIREQALSSDLDNQDDFAQTDRRLSKASNSRQPEEVMKHDDDLVATSLKSEKIRTSIESRTRELAPGSDFDKDNLDDLATDRRQSKPPWHPEEALKLKDDFIATSLENDQIRTSIESRIRELAPRSDFYSTNDPATDRRQSKPSTLRQPEEVVKHEDDLVTTSPKNESRRTSIESRRRELAPRSDLDKLDDIATDRRQSKPSTPWQPEEALKVKDDIKLMNDPIRTSIESRIRELAPRSDLASPNDLPTDRRQSKPSTPRQPEEALKLNDDFIVTSLRNEQTRTSIESRIKESVPRSDSIYRDDLATNDRRQSKPSTPRQPEEAIQRKDDFVATSLENEPKRNSVESRIREPTPRSDLDDLGDLATSDRRQSKPSTQRPPEEVIKFNDDFMATSLNTEPRRTSVQSRIREMAPRSDLDNHDLTVTDRRESKPSTPQKPEEAVKLKDDFVATSLNTEPRRTSVESRVREDLDNLSDLATDRRQSKSSIPRQPGEVLRLKDDFASTSLKNEPIRSSVGSRIWELAPRSDLHNHDDDATTDRRQSKPSTPQPPEEIVKKGEDDLAATSVYNVPTRNTGDKRIKEPAHRSDSINRDDLAMIDRRQSTPRPPEEVIKQEDDFAATSVFNVPIRTTGETRIRDPPRSDANKHDVIGATDRRQSKNSTPQQPEEVIKPEDDFVSTSLKDLPTRTTAETKLRELAPRSEIDKHDDLPTTDRRQSTPRQPEEVIKKKDDFFTTSLKDLPKRTSADTRLRELDLNINATTERRRSKISTPRQSEDIVNHKDDLIDLTLFKNVQKGSSGESRRRELSRLSDSENHDDLERLSRTSALSLKQTLYSIDTTLREHSMAIDRLTKKLESLAESHRATVFRVQNIPSVTTSTQTLDIYGGLLLAILLQAFLTWIFYYKN